VIWEFESGRRSLSPRAQDMLRKALEGAGIVFNEDAVGAMLGEGIMKLTSTQCKAARELLGWTLLDLGYRSRTSEKTVSRFETMRGVTRPDNVEAMRRALETAGVEFIAENGGGAGVRLSKGKP
jgi:hypothetical protein